MANAEAANLKIVTKNFGVPDSHKLSVYQQRGGGQAFRKALTMQPAALVDEVKKSNLRGRGGAGFPTGMKWSFIPKEAKTVYLVVNADESEPGTCKDRELMAYDPHLLLEGMLIASYALGCKHAYIYIRGEMMREARIVDEAIDEAYAAGLLGKEHYGASGAFKLDITLHRGAGAYICGEETGMLESLEGKKGWPRLKPPFPAVVGLFGCPTVVNNVETLAAVPAIFQKGAYWFAKLGPEKSGGTRMVCLSGSVNRPGVFEVMLSTTVRELIESPDFGQGMPAGRKVKAVIPGGSSAPVLAADEIDVALEFEALKAVQNMAGSGGVIVMDDATCLVRSLWRVSRFYAEESCGQCTPCREGTPWMTRILRKLEEGRGEDGDLETLLNVAQSIAPYPPMGLGQTICALGDAAALPVHSFIVKFRQEFEDHIRLGKCPFGDKPWGYYGAMTP
ncbi:MAG TPA: NADH-quinone oxidoreductase subunit NuoF [Polyangia bacterium]